KCRAPAGLRLNPDSTAVHLDDPLGDGQPQAGAALFAGNGIVGLLKLLKQLGLVGSGNARASVADKYMECAIDRFGLDRNLAGIGELDGVADKIDQYLRQAATVTVPWRQFAGKFKLECELLVSRERLQRAADGLRNIPDAVVGEFAHELASLDLGEIKHVVD